MNIRYSASSKINIFTYNKNTIANKKLKFEIHVTQK